MTLLECLNHPSMKAKEQVLWISEQLLTGNITQEELLNVAANLNESKKANCIESLEMVTKENLYLLSENSFLFVVESLSSKAPRVQWESARVIGNTATLFPNQIEKAVTKLLQQVESKGTVVRWSTAYALSQIALAAYPINDILLPTLENIAQQEEKNSIKKIYLTALKKISKTK